MRPIVIAALVLLVSACRPAAVYDVNATPPVRPEARLAAIYTGTWHGVSWRDGSDLAMPWTLVQYAELDGSIVGRLTFDGLTIPPAEVKLVEATDSTYAALIGPYFSPTVGADVVTRVTGTTRGDRIVGTWSAHPVAGGRTTNGRFEATREARTSARQGGMR